MAATRSTSKKLPIPEVLTIAIIAVLPGCPSPTTEPLPPLCGSDAGSTEFPGSCTDPTTSCLVSRRRLEDGGSVPMRFCPLGITCAMPPKLIAGSALFAGTGTQFISPQCCTVISEGDGGVIETRCPEGESTHCFGVTRTLPDGTVNRYSVGC